MAAKHQPTVKDFKPKVETSEEDGCTILTIHIPGFSKEQIRVQVTSKRELIISGERPYRNQAKQCFHKEFRIPPNCDAANITAKYKAGILYVRQPAPRPEWTDDGGYEKVEVKSTGIFHEFMREFLLAYVMALMRVATQKMVKLVLAILVVVLLFMVVKRMKDSNVNP